MSNNNLLLIIIISILGIAGIYAFVDTQDDLLLQDHLHKAGKEITKQIDDFSNS